MPLLVNAFLETYRAPGNVDEAALEETLRALIGRAREKYPLVMLDDATFAGHLGGCLEPEDAALERLVRLHATDLFLARACADHDPHALVVFEVECMGRAEGSVGRKGVSSDAVEEAKQNIRERMLVGEGTPRVLDYRGRGPLKDWLGVAVIREAIHLSKAGNKEKPLTFELFSMADAHATPEVEYFKSHYRAEYKAAFELAISQLDARQRSLLRQQYVLGMTIDQIGVIYQIHRATASRWTQMARDELLAKARFELARRTGLSRVELEGVVRMIESQLDVSLNRLLESRASRR